MTQLDGILTFDPSDSVVLGRDTLDSGWIW
jgi:hypothetical protein